MAREEIEVRLRGLEAPDGMISLGDLAPLANALQLLTTRIARDLHGQAGPGRTLAAIEALARLRLGGLRAGSTKLDLVAGEGTLAIGDPFERQTFDRFWQIIEGLGVNHRPEWVSPNVAEAALNLATALGPARTVEFSGQRDGVRRTRVRVAVRNVKRDAWRMQEASERLADVTAVGILDAVDLQKRSFRIRDDVGHNIPLDDVENISESAALIGQRVRAVGQAIPGERGQVTRMVNVSVSSLDLPPSWIAAERGNELSLSAWLGAASASQGPSTAGIEGVTDEDLDEFLASLRA